MELAELRALLAVARQGSFTRAAKGLGVSQPSLSRQVQRLERELGARLVLRAPGGAALTEAGARFVAHAERALAALESGAVELAELGGKPSGSVGVGTLATVGALVLPGVIAEYHRRHPAVRLRVREGLRDELEALVLRGELDLAIIQLPPRHEELSAVKLWRESYLLAVPPKHALARGRGPLRLADVATEPFVLIPGGTAVAALERACEARGVRPNVALVTDNIESVRRMVDAGLGLGLVPRMLARDKRGWRARLRPTVEAIERNVGMVFRGAGYLSAAARALKEMLAARAREFKV